MADHRVALREERLLLYEPKDRNVLRQPSQAVSIEVLAGCDEDTLDARAAGRAQGSRAQEVPRLGVEDGAERDEYRSSVSFRARPRRRRNVVGHHLTQ